MADCAEEPNAVLRFSRCAIDDSAEDENPDDAHDCGCSEFWR